MELNQFFKSLIDQDDQAILLSDLSQTVLYMNPQAINMFQKYGGAKLLGNNLMECHPPYAQEAIKRVIAWFEKDISHNRVFTYYDEKHNRDVYMVALRDENGTLIGYYEKHASRIRETGKRYDFYD